ncbi:mycothiol synthase [Jiangella alba]|uniref:Mycothiol acetyltransferase n=1 Tax=Jiangella alba TaxID=561176 RepID=A0A1H5P8B1_9ACTN|nr:mycothiol synthase [Jiangella alba]SEF10095.1 mycothiol synthase [Jiangella alba]
MATTFTPAELAQVTALAERARAADGVAPFSDDLFPAARSGATIAALTVPTGAGAGEPAGTGELAGAAYAARQGDRQAAELVIDPARRGQGLGGGLLADLLGAVSGELWLWSHGDHPAAAALARRHGLVRARELLQLRRRIAPGELPEPVLPDGVRLRPFVVGQDEAAWLEVNNAAFDWHPEQGGQTLDDIAAAEAASDFDPAGFLLAVDADDRVLGFHWTKVHPHDPNPGRDMLSRRGPESSGPGGGVDAPLGEVYVLGVAPSAHGRGLGGALTIAGLRHLADVAGVRTVTLYVEGDNTAAVRLYEREGFTRHAIDVAYRRD